MQFRSWTCALPLLALTVQLCAGSVLRTVSRQEAAATSTSGAWAALAEAEADDRRFWGEQWAGLEATLLELQEATGGLDVKVSNGTSVHAPAKEAVALPGNQTTAAKAAEVKRSSPLADRNVNLNPKSAADLVPALGMLKSLYEDGKERITQLNAREQQSKQRFEEMEKAHQARMATIEERFKNGTLSAEFHANETRDENRLWSYWQRVRERQHRQFHTSLKIQHGTMQKVKTMIDMYEKTIAGKASKADVQSGLAKVAGVVPEVVLLQQAWRADAPFFREALMEARAAGAEIAKSKSRR